MSKKKNIWLISKYLNLPLKGNFPGRGFSLLREFAKNGYDCSLIVAEHESLNFSNIFSKEILNVDGVKIVKIKIIKYNKAKSLLRIIGWVQFEIKLFFLKKKILSKPDIIICSSLSILSIVNGIYLRWKYSCKLIFEIRDIWPLVLIENGGFSRFNPFVIGLQFIEWLGYKFSDEIVGTMPKLDLHVEKILGSKKNVTCIPMGVSEELLNQKNEILPECFNSFFPRDKFIVTYAGSIGIDNALDTLFESVRKLSSYKKIIFVIAGKGDLLESYKEKCSSLENVKFLGNVDIKYIQSILKRSSILYFAAHPTKVLEYGQSLNKIIDYMFSGTPIIASYSGYPSMINEAKCGLFVPAGDSKALTNKLVELSGHSASELDEMGMKGKNWILKNRQYSLLASDYQQIF